MRQSAEAAHSRAGSKRPGKPQQVARAKLGRVESHRVRELVHLLFHREGDLVHAKSAKRAGERVVREHRTPHGIEVTSPGGGVYYDAFDTRVNLQVNVTNDGLIALCVLSKGGRAQRARLSSTMSAIGG